MVKERLKRKWRMGERAEEDGTEECTMRKKKNNKRRRGEEERRGVQERPTEGRLSSCDGILSLSSSFSLFSF